MKRSFRGSLSSCNSRPQRIVYGRVRMAPCGRDWSGRWEPRSFQFHRGQNLCNRPLWKWRFQSKSRTVESPPRPPQTPCGDFALRSLREFSTPRTPRVRPSQARFARQLPQRGSQILWSLRSLRGVRARRAVVRFGWRAGEGRSVSRGRGRSGPVCRNGRREVARREAAIRPGALAEGFDSSEFRFGVFGVFRGLQR